jgi:hypothetical protein
MKRQLAFGLGVGLLVNLAHANTISIFDLDGVALTEGKSKNAVQYSASCVGSTCMEGFFIDSLTGLSVDSATGYLISSADPANELDFLNGLLDDNEPALTHVNQVDIAANSFTTDRQYFSIKQSTFTAYFLNTTGGEITVQFDPTTFSHYTEYELSAVPLPPAATLFGSAMGLIGLLGWRNRKQAAA